MTCYTKAEIIGKNPAITFIHKEDLSNFFKDLRELNLGKPVKAGEYSIKRKDGTSFLSSL